MIQVVVLFLVLSHLKGDLGFGLRCTYGVLLSSFYIWQEDSSSEQVEMKSLESHLAM